MGKVTGFIEYQREVHHFDQVKKRIKNFKEFVQPLSKEKLEKQGARCMDCGIPFCQPGCPLNNMIPDFNHFVYQQDRFNAYRILKSTNNFPDITGRICPAPCESSCVLGINQPPVSIKSIEYAIAQEGLKKGWNEPHIPPFRTDQKIAIVGSGPAGLACADQLNQSGHTVVVYERDDQIGGLLTYGIPNFKLDKQIVFDHVKRMKKEGIGFITDCEIGKEIMLHELQEQNDSVVLTVGSTLPRELAVEQFPHPNVHFAMSFLKQATRRVLKLKVSDPIEVKNKRVLVIGGGDTGSDCVGTSTRLGCKKVTQIEIAQRPPLKRDEHMPWPLYERIFRISSSQEEGCERKFSLLTKKLLLNDQGDLTGIEYVDIDWDKDQKHFKEKKEKKILSAEVIFLAMGYTGADPVATNGLDITYHARGMIHTRPNSYHTEHKGLFVAGDARRGQSLVVWAISEGRECAREVDQFLSGSQSSLESKDKSFYEID